MTEAQKITIEIARLGNKIERLKQSLKKIQQNCPHEFVDNSYYQKCKKCLKVEALYY